MALSPVIVLLVLAAGLCLCLLLHISASILSLHYQLHPPYIVGLGPEVNESIFLWGTVVGVLPIGYLVGGKRVNWIRSVGASPQGIQRSQ